MDTGDTVCSGCSRIVVYGGGDIVFDTERSNQWTQYTVDTVHSGIVDMMVGTLSLVQKGQTSGHNRCSRILVYVGGNIVFDTKRSLHPLCPLI